MFWVRHIVFILDLHCCAHIRKVLYLPSAVNVRDLELLGNAEVDTVWKCEPFAHATEGGTISISLEMRSKTKKWGLVL